MPRLLGIEKFIKSHTKVYNMKPIRTDWCLGAEDIYRWTNPAKWNVTCSFAKKHGADQQYHYCSRVLLYFMQLVLEDIIENNITFEIPCVGKKEARIYVKCYSDEEFAEMYKRGLFRGIDYIKSGFKGYQIIFQWKYNNRKMREKPIHIDRTNKARFYELINNGKQYY